MSRTFRAPITHFSPANELTQSAIEALLAASGPQSCLRIDFMVSDVDIVAIDKSDVTFYLLDDEGNASYQEHRKMDPALRPLFLEVLAEINEDTFLGEAMGGYPLPWKDYRFGNILKGRFLSLIFLSGGMGAVIQEYIPNFLPDDEAQNSDYFDDDAEADVRCEIMSLYLPPKVSNHQNLQVATDLQSRHPILSAMFRRHCDEDIGVALAKIDPSDVFK